MTPPPQKRLLLLGGGHAHVEVLKSFALHPPPHTQLTLISKDPATPYSGMLPGLIAGHYTFDEAHINLQPLCKLAGAQFIRDTILRLDPANQLVHCENSPPTAFDILSINTGSTPANSPEHALPVKPIDRFLRGLDDIIKKVTASPTQKWRIAVVGAGAGGVELLLAIRHRLSFARNLEFQLIADSPTILPTHNPRVREIFQRILNERHVETHLDCRVTEVTHDQLFTTTKVIPFDFAFWVTNASPPPWIASSGLQTDPQGFIALHDTLQSISHPNIFAAGDIAAVLNHPRPKAGVFAVRQGPPLAQNLRRFLANQPLIPFQPQKNFLSLITRGDRCAIASRGQCALEGAWLWTLKNWIDRRWMRQYQHPHFH